MEFILDIKMIFSISVKIIHINEKIEILALIYQ